MGNEKSGVVCGRDNQGESQIDTGRYLQILGQLEGDLYHTTFRPRIEEVLMKQNG